jgi:hypothetical protein
MSVSHRAAGRITEIIYRANGDIDAPLLTITA